jgi:dethiobiotin synthetase
MAAAALGWPAFTIDDLVGELRRPGDVGLCLVETAGGVRSPLADDGDTVTLVERLVPDRILLVADAGLGTINAVAMSIDVLGRDRRGAVTVFLNRYDPLSDLHVRNHDWLVQRLALDCVTHVSDLFANPDPGTGTGG